MAGTDRWPLLGHKVAGRPGPAQSGDRGTAWVPSAAMPDFFEVVTTQRAARSFTTDEVDDVQVSQILTAATHAPSAENSQPFVFIVVRDAESRAAIGALTERLWDGGARALEESRLSPAFLNEVDQGARGGIAAAPVLIVVCGDTRLTYAVAMDASVFPAVQNLLLATHALGLGSTLTTLPTLGGDELRELLHLPAEVVPVAVIPIGHLARPLGPPRRQPLREKAHLNRYGTPFG
jgi:nitroreductase